MAKEPGRPADFPELWSRWRPRAAAYALAFGGLSPEDREEIASDAVFQAWRRLDLFDPRKPFAPWFLAIVRNLALDVVARTGSSSAEIESFDLLPSSQRGAEEELSRASEADFVRDFLQASEARDRELASLVYGQELGIAEAARLLGLPAGTAKWRLHELRKALKRAWEIEYGEVRAL